MDFDFDQYYTPVDLAKSILSDHITDYPKICVDTTCGAGYLLKAASKVFRDVKCFGIDRDKKAIHQLRREHPTWTLSVADLLKPNSYSRSSVLTSLDRCDLLVLNPPFSLRHIKNVEVSYCGNTLRCSIAMAHILTSLQLLRPKQGAIVFTPESVLYSETDKEARELLAEHYGIERLTQLSNSTFAGARANASVVRISPDSSSIHRTRGRRKFAGDPISCKMIRGSVPVHLMQSSAVGTPFVHSTDLQRITNADLRRYWPLTSTNRVHQPEGWVILLPRVGTPKIEYARAFHLKSVVQLSDCVIALVFDNKRNALSAQTRLHLRWESLVDIYRGTGARYTTVTRLADWLASIGITTLSAKT